MSKYGKAITVRIPTDLYNKVRETEQRTGIKKSHIVIEALEKWVRDEKV